MDDFAKKLQKTFRCKHALINMKKLYYQFKSFVLSELSSHTHTHIHTHKHTNARTHALTHARTHAIFKVAFQAIPGALKYQAESNP